jgi:hypothetical protein
VSNNRSEIVDSDVLRPPQLLDKGLPLPGLENSYVVDEGWCAVITEGGAYKEILEPGTHFLGRYSFWRNVKATLVDRRVRTLTVSTTREFSIAHPVPVQINLDLQVEYRVSDPRRVAMEVSTPLTSLFDRVIGAVRGAAVNATIDEIRTQGDGLARAAMHALQAMRLPAVLGIEVLNVHVTTIRATDTGSDALATQQMKEFTTIRDWQLDTAMLQQSQMTPEWLIVHRPELYQQMLAGNQMLLKEMIDKGLLDPAGVLNQPLAGGFGIDPLRMFPGQGFGVPQTPQLPSRPPADIHARMREEVSYLQKLSGATVSVKPGADDSGIPDGSYDLMLEMPRISSGRLTLYFVCAADYPTGMPLVEAELDGQSVPFESAVTRRWTGQYLVEIAREARQYFG